MSERFAGIGLIAAIVLLCVASTVRSENRGPIQFDHADLLDVRLSPNQDTTVALGSVVFRTETGIIYCDTAYWLKGKSVTLIGQVIMDDEEYRLIGDSVYYNLIEDTMIARGSYVELWSRKDSLFAVGTHASYDKKTEFFFMEDRPTVFLEYPDSANMIEVIADEVRYDAAVERAWASGDVNINTRDMNSESGCAVMNVGANTLDLFDNPVARRKRSTISGSLISITSEAGQIKRLDVIDTARGEFVEPVEGWLNEYDRSILTGNRIIFDFIAGDLRQITCWGQAYSWYYPSARGRNEITENTVSGDTIKLFISNERLNTVEVIGGAVGTYISGAIAGGDSTHTDSLPADTTASGAALADSLKSELAAIDTATVHLDTVSVDDLTDSIAPPPLVTKADTISYNSHHIEYAVKDSVIILTRQAHVTSGTVALDAFRILYLTRDELVKAYSADIIADTSTENIFISELQPNDIPVVLKDGDEELFGDYLEYSIETEKGRILQSKSRYETGYYYGDDVYRARENIFYVEDGRYTTCDAAEPHFHFHSNNMKFIENDKLIASPVILYIGRLPIVALPYYVFPLKKGRHSGFTQFTLGNIEQGDRYLRNLGYYWAPSEYWDLLGAFDYTERRNAINLYGKFTYNKRYSFNGSVSGNYTREIDYNPTIADETRPTRWTLSASHNHDISPTFKVSGTGQIQSDATYYNDYSADLDDRLNRTIRSKINFSKRFSNSFALSGIFAHDENLDEESRTDQLPSLNFSLPTLRPFGAGSVNEEGRIEPSWFNRLTVTYRPSLINYSSRITVDSLANQVYDTSIVVTDSATMATDTTITLLSQDTLGVRSRRKYTKVNHSVNPSLSFDVAKYIRLIPSFSYNETWFKIWETDQSRAAGIDAEQTYRTYSYRAGADISTTLYGTVYPNLFGLLGLRQVLEPRVGYFYTPEIDRHPEIRSFAGGGAGSTSKSQSLSMSLKQVYLAKVKTGETERTFQLVSITSSLAYDFEREVRPYSNLSTSFSSNVLGQNLRFSGNMIHSLYKTGTDELDFWSPSLESFNFNADFSVSGRRFLFDEPETPLRGADSASQVGDRRAATPARPSGWTLRGTYGYSQSGHDDFFTKSNFIRFSLDFNLTPTTRISYAQYYDFDRDLTINNSVSITKNLHCWTGTLYWVPNGSNKGYGFRLYVTAIPAIKIDNSENALSSGYLQTLR